MVLFFYMRMTIYHNILFAYLSVYYFLFSPFPTLLHCRLNILFPLPLFERGGVQKGGGGGCASTSTGRNYLSSRFPNNLAFFMVSSLFLTSASFPPSLHMSPSLRLAALVVPSWAVQSLPSPENEF